MSNTFVECRSGTHNSHEDGDDADTNSSGTLTYVVIAVTVGGIFIFACIVVFAMWTYKSKHRSVTAQNAPPDYATCAPMNTKFENKNVKFDNCGKSSADIFRTDYEHLRY
ncbi:hypothetical protein MAR_037855 [Mya arenaria]|uniref:Uncharacterized protein n=1 Tax=Mya arenaria TaxID=6604 RepID=A0ABY7FTY4_MYAAR|nr:hypothetical protein MAR_037855 [Mya arenaria]